MIDKLYKKYSRVFSYIFFGVCTTLINIFSYLVCTRIFNINVNISTLISWCLSVFFAYISNRIFVFKSQNYSRRSIITEISSFFTCRVLSGMIDFVIMFIFVNLMGIEDIFIKIISNLFIIIFNYVASRILIFKNHMKM